MVDANIDKLNEKLNNPDTRTSLQFKMSMAAVVLAFLSLLVSLLTFLSIKKLPPDQPAVETNTLR